LITKLTPRTKLLAQLEWNLRLKIMQHNWT